MDEWRCKYCEDTFFKKKDLVKHVNSWHWDVDDDDRSSFLGTIMSAVLAADVIDTIGDIFGNSDNNDSDDNDGFGDNFGGGSFSGGGASGDW